MKEIAFVKRPMTEHTQFALSIGETSGGLIN